MNTASLSMDSEPSRRAAKLPPSLNQAVMLICFIVVCFAAAGIGGVLTGQSVDTWYRSISKPAWNPPDWIFGPVWTVLYLMMAVASWLVWRRARWAECRGALLLFAVQLALNVIWSGLFFAARSPGLAFAELLLLWMAIAATIVAFSRHSRAAAALMVPYLAWTTFAAVLNFAVWRLNS